MSALAALVIFTAGIFGGFLLSVVSAPLDMVPCVVRCEELP